VATLDRLVTTLIHPDAIADAVERTRHLRFLSSHIATGFVALTLLPVYLLIAGRPSAFEVVAFACLVAPLASALVLSKTGRLDWAHSITSLGLASLIATVAAASGGISSPVLVWLVLVPMEALLHGSSRSVIVAGAIALAMAGAVAVLHAAGLVSGTVPWKPLVAIPVFTAAAIGYGIALALEACHREKSRQAAREGRLARSRALVGAVEDLLTWHDHTGGVLFASHAAERMLGVRAHSLKGQGLFDRVHIADRPAYLKALTDAASGLNGTSLQFRLRAGEDGEPPRMLWVEMRSRFIQPTKGEDGLPPLVVSVTRDITDRIRQQEELAAAKSAAEEASVSKGRFLATVSHELRTPLNAIIGFSEMLSQDELMAADPSRRAEYARIIHASGRHLFEVVSAIIDMSKIETGNFDFRPEPFDPVELANGCCDLMKLEADQAKVSLMRDIAPGQAEIVADRRAMKQIMLNLLSNAIKFTPAGGLVTLAVEQTEKRFIIRVIDDGIGIAQEDLGKLGAPFFQARSSYDRPYEGTGLGLSVVRGLLGLHGGAIAIESAPGAGTTVTVTMPLDCSATASVHHAPAAIATFPRDVSHPEAVHTVWDNEAVKRRA
jgi:two-component system, cell cycle sensor histidine kinase DivJ